MCLLVTRAPSSSLAGSCLEELVSAERLFEAAAADSKPASNNLVCIGFAFNRMYYFTRSFRNR